MARIIWHVYSLMARIFARQRTCIASWKAAEVVTGRISRSRRQASLDWLIRSIFARQKKGRMVWGLGCRAQVVGVGAPTMAFQLLFARQRRLNFSWGSPRKNPMSLRIAYRRVCGVRQRAYMASWKAAEVVSFDNNHMTQISFDTDHLIPIKTNQQYGTYTDGYEPPETRMQGSLVSNDTCIASWKAAEVVTGCIHNGTYIRSTTNMARIIWHVYLLDSEYGTHEMARIFAHGSYIR